VVGGSCGGDTGVAPALLDSGGKELAGEATGNLVIKHGMTFT